MHATHILYYFLTHACAWMHAARRQVLAVSVLAALTGRRVTVTALGRSIVRKTRAKLGIEHLVPRSGTPLPDLFSMPPLSANPYLTFAVSGSLALQLLAFVIPGLRKLLGLTSLTFLDRALVGASAAILPLVVNEGTKGHWHQQ